MPALLTRSRNIVDTAVQLARQLFYAWRAEMAALFDLTVGVRLSRSTTHARLFVEAGELVVAVRAAGKWTELSRHVCATEPALLIEGLKTLTATLPSTIRTIEVQWPSNRTLRHSIDLPNAARARIKQAIELQLDRLTPFRPEDIYFTCGEQGVSQRNGHLCAQLAVAPRCEVDSWVAALDAEGRRTVRVVTGAVPAVSSVLLQRRGSRALSWSTRMEWVLVGALAGLVTLIVAAAAWHQHVEQRLIDERLDVLRPQATKAEEARAALEQRLRQVAFLSQQLANTDVAQVLSALNHDLPGDSWIFQLQQEQRTVTVSGFAKNATTIAAALASEPLFSNAQLRSALQQPNAGNERFDIILTLREPATPNGAAR